MGDDHPSFGGGELFSSKGHFKYDGKKVLQMGGGLPRVPQRRIYHEGNPFLEVLEMGGDSPPHVDPI